MGDGELAVCAYISLMVEGQLVGSHGQCLQLSHVDGGVAVEDCLRTAGTGVDVQSSCMRCRRGGGDRVLLLRMHNESGSHGIAVVLAGLDGVAALTELGAPGARTHLTVVEPDVGIVLHIDGYLAEMAAHVLHLHIHHLGVLAVVEGDDDGVLALVNAVLCHDRMTSVVHIPVIDRRLTEVFAIDGHIRLGL